MNIHSHKSSKLAKVAQFLSKTVFVTKKMMKFSRFLWYIGTNLWYAAFTKTFTEKMPQFNTISENFRHVYIKKTYTKTTKLTYLCQQHFCGWKTSTKTSTLNLNNRMFNLIHKNIHTNIHINILSCMCDACINPKLYILKFSIQKTSVQKYFWQKVFFAKNSSECTTQQVQTNFFLVAWIGKLSGAVFFTSFLTD